MERDVQDGRHTDGAFKAARTRLRYKALIALVLAVAVLELDGWSGRLPHRAVEAVTWTLSPAWQREVPVQNARRALVRFIESRSWGAFLALIGPAPGSARTRPDAPVAVFQVVRGFGWTREPDGRFDFNSATLLSVHRGVPVRAPERARILTWSGRQVELRLPDGATLTLEPVRLARRRPARVAYGTVLGTTIGRTLAVAARERGIPVDPDGPGLYGSVLGGQG